MNGRRYGPPASSRLERRHLAGSSSRTDRGHRIYRLEAGAPAGKMPAVQDDTTPISPSARPVLATVFSLLIIVFGLIAFTRLPLRELPDVDRPIVSVNAVYRGASAQVVETRVTRRIEDQLSGIEGVDLISSTSRDGHSP